MRILVTELELRADDAAHNFDLIARAVEQSSPSLEADDVLLLPELVDLGPSRTSYVARVRHLARQLGCYVVGGSHYRSGPRGRINWGLAVDPTGAECGSYEKRRPYGGAVDAASGAALPPFEIGGRSFRTLVCADFWYGEFWHEVGRPDVVLVPALSVSRKSNPAFARDMWRHMAISRAYEFGVFVAISDWAHGTPDPYRSASGVAGLADPTGTDPARFFQRVGPAGVRAVDLDFAALDHFRADRRKRRFLDSALSADV